MSPVCWMHSIKMPWFLVHSGDLATYVLRILTAGSSPRRYRRDEKHERDRDRGRDRVPGAANLENGGHMGRDQRNHRLLNDALPPEAPLAHHSKQDSGAVHKDTDKKPNDHNEAPKHAPDPTQVPRSLSYFQVLYKCYA